MRRLEVKIGHSKNSDPKSAIEDIKKKVHIKDMDLDIFFCSSKYDLNILAKELMNAFDCQVAGCTTSGEISPIGYCDNGIVAAGIKSDEINVHLHLLSHLSSVTSGDYEKLVNRIKRNLPFSILDKKRMFGLLFIDGLSLLEDEVIASLYNHLEGISVTGGSAGDDCNFQGTHVYSGGVFYNNAAVLVLFDTTLKFKQFKIQHFEPTDTKFVITGAVPEKRLITEINGSPAAIEYANILNVKKEELNPTIFSENPLMIKIGGDYYVRSIQKITDDNSLRLFCSIEEGLVLTLGKGGDIIENLKSTLNKMDFDPLKTEHLAIFCDCILRKLEIVDRAKLTEMNKIFSGLNVIGFNTYGEQYNSIHVNQTLTGVILHG